MANALYQNFINNMQGNGTHTHVALHGHAVLRCFLREEGTSGAPDLALDLDAADVSGGAIECDAALTSVVAGNTTIGSTLYGGFDHAIVTWSSVAGTVTYESIDYFDDTSAVDATAPLICNIDTATGLSPVTSNGGNITWDPSANGVFQQTTGA